MSDVSLVEMREGSREAYERWHSELLVDGADAPWHRLVKSHLVPHRDLAGKRVLEIGAGRGGFAAWLGGLPSPPACLVAGDFSVTATRKGRAARAGSNVLFEVADIQALGHGERAFDTVISCETVEHVPNPRRAVAELARVLRPGGRLFLTTPNYLGTMGLFRAYRRITRRPFTEEGQPINHLVMLPRTLRWVRRAGLEVRTVDGIGHYLPIPGRAPKHLPGLDGMRSISRWFAHHSLVVAERV